MVVSMLRMKILPGYKIRMIDGETLKDQAPSLGPKYSGSWSVFPDFPRFSVQVIEVMRS